MDYNDLRNYIFRYIRQFTPYKDSEFYQVLVSFLEEELLKDSYENIPEQFKVLFEEHSLDTYLYDIVLRSIGYPRDLVESLPSTHKQIILNTFSDYNTRKGTLKIIREIASSFGDPINIYELYADFKYNSGIWDWWFVPKVIYENTDLEAEIKYYDNIYNDTPTYFVSKQQLHNYLIDERISLPIKSNLLLLTLANQTSANELTILTMMTALHHFKDSLIEINMNNGTYEISLIGLYQLWNYLLSYYHGKVNTARVEGEIVYFDISGATFYYTLEEGLPNSIKTVHEKYNDLLYADEIRTFYKEYIADIFTKNAPSTIATITTLRKSLLYSIDIDLLVYIENQIETSTDIESEIVSILQELKESIKVYINNSNDDLLYEYKDYILDVFELSIIVPAKTTTYKLIDFFKPFHTQLISEQKLIVKNDSKFNNAGILDSYRMFVIRDFPGTAMVISDDMYFNERILGSFSVTTTYIETNLETIYNSFEIGDQIFIRPQDCPTDPNGPYRPYTYEHLNIIVAKEIVSETEYRLILETEFTGTVGLYNSVYKRYHMLQLEGDI